MASADGIKDPYLATIDLYTSENIKLYNKAIVGLTESDRYDLTRSKWTNFTNNWSMLYPNLYSNSNF